MARNEVVLWSGGFDSTLILHDLITKGIIPFALTVTHINNLLINKEKESRDKLEKRLGEFDRKEYICGKATDTVADFTRDYWLTELFNYMPDNSNVYMGIHMLDVIGRKPVRKEFDDFIADFESKAQQKEINVKLELPLEHMYKDDILEKMWELGLFTDCWNCEGPQGLLPCGECMPCKRVGKWRSKHENRNSWI